MTTYDEAYSSIGLYQQQAYSYGPFGIKPEDLYEAVQATTSFVAGVTPLFEKPEPIREDPAEKFHRVPNRAMRRSRRR